MASVAQLEKQLRSLSIAVMAASPKTRGKYQKRWDAVRAKLEKARSKTRNPGGRKLTKLQRKVKAAKASAKRRVAVALAKYLKQENPGRKIVGAKVTKGKGGRRTITPIFAKRGKR